MKQSSRIFTSMGDKIKDIVRNLLAFLPNKFRYVLEWLLVNKRIPKYPRHRDIREFFFYEILSGRIDKYYKHADKILARDIIKNKGLNQILPQLYGTWNNANEIDFNLLPNKFVLKCNHGCGLNIICTEKSKLNIQQSILLLNKWLQEKHPIYYETQYNKITPKILCEEFIDDGSGEAPADYKFHCTNGKVICIQVVDERDSEANTPCRIEFLDTDWSSCNFLDFDLINSQAHIEFRPFESLPKKPKNLDKMIEYAQLLSEGIDYVRVDLYDTGNQVYFGEFTITPLGGNLWYLNDKAIKVIGEQVQRNQ